MGALKDITGYKFNGCTVISRASNKGKYTAWNCICRCGNQFIARSGDIKSGNTKSCGCYCKEISGDKARTHGKRETRLYTIWSNMKSRCINTNNVNYKNYGGKGITICNSWMNSFENFYKWAIKNGYKDNLTIDRIDNNDDYKPENCRWADYKSQERNRTNNHVITYNGRTLSMAEWAEITGIPYKTLWKRIKDGWSAEKALTRPLRGTSKIIRKDGAMVE